MTPRRISSRRNNYPRRSKPMPGMATGICVPSMMMAACWVRSKNNECQIDSIAQSWAVLSQAADPLRAAQAMESVNTTAGEAGRATDSAVYTALRQTDEHDPGYIKGYLPGVRENGGQYTHAAIWTAWAFAELGQGDRARELFRMLNPISHADTPEKAEHYKVEPYVIAADIYSQPPHTGMRRLDLVHRLGRLDVPPGSRSHPGHHPDWGNASTINPCIPRNWPGFKVDYRFGTTHYKISVENPNNVNRGIRQVMLDGNPLPGSLIPLVEDGQTHEVKVVMG